MQTEEDYLEELLLIPLLVSLIMPVGTLIIQAAELPLGYTILLYVLLYTIPACIIWNSAKSMAESIGYSILWFISSCVVVYITKDLWSPIITIALAVLIIWWKNKNDKKK